MSGLISYIQFISIEKLSSRQYHFCQTTRLTITADLVVKDDVSWSDVEMEDVPAVDEAETRHDLPDENPALVLCQLVVRVRQSLEQIPT